MESWMRAFMSPDLAVLEEKVAEGNYSWGARADAHDWVTRGL